MFRRLLLIGSWVVVAGACDPGPPEVAVAKGPEAAGLRPADGGMDVPPTGLYAVTVKVVADDCTPKYAPPPAWQVRVDGKAEGGRASITVPVSALPPTTTTRTAAHNNFVVMPAAPVTRKNDGAVDCGPASRTFEVVRASREGFTLAISTVYGERGTCDASQPAKCTTKIEQVHKLVEFQCAAECYRGTRATGDGATTVDCRCP
jgi:hypothetical protein